ncbi:hypothetical protein BDP55DRAFT_716785 [Colletotrichum godetiae]|uniref:Uncharacterized protein n=1 Tax=Colletotrichum godetiae TaxID=1209918 RepID=A0AAJ0EU16_9PEZI|nr:uncharacterized protein BDP55DRAFT_716785 [Colletotrichum godetiae]KAK1673868.1 hypothetical protein BDP55DRAFT_716785 [Colletotrichum godetiae]
MYEVLSNIMANLPTWSRNRVNDLYCLLRVFSLKRFFVSYRTAFTRQSRIVLEATSVLHESRLLFRYSTAYFLKAVEECIRTIDIFGEDGMNGQLEWFDLSKSRLAVLRSLQHMVISDGGEDRRHMAYLAVQVTLGGKKRRKKGANLDPAAEKHRTLLRVSFLVDSRKIHVSGTV